MSTLAVVVVVTPSGVGRGCWSWLVWTMLGGVSTLAVAVVAVTPRGVGQGCSVRV